MPPNFCNKLYAASQHHMGVHNTHHNMNTIALHSHHMQPTTIWDPYLSACTTMPQLARYLPVYPPCCATTSARRRSIEAISLDNIQTGTLSHRSKRAAFSWWMFCSFFL
jgi:hypothetical protein